MRTKVKKGPVVHDWRRDVVQRSVEQEQLFGPGKPMKNNQLDAGAVDLVVDELERQMLLDEEDMEVDDLDEEKDANTSASSSRMFRKCNN